MPVSESQLSLACVQAVRDKVVSNLASSLAKAASEVEEGGAQPGPARCHSCGQDS